MDKWITTTTYGWSALKKCAVLGCLLTGTAYSEPPPSKPYRICPEIVTAKDVPCRSLGAEAMLAQRKEVVPEKKVEIKEKIIYVDNPALTEKLRALEEENRSLKDQLDKSRPKVDIDRPAATRAIRG